MPVHTHAAATEKTRTSNQKSFRLKPTVVPRRYELRLAADLEGLRFSGRETIEVLVKETTDRIVLNAVDLRFLDVYVESNDGTRLNGSVEEDRETELVALVFDGVLGCGIWHLKIAFAGELSEKLRGFYRSIWVDQEGERHTIASTHFEPTHARRAFPCFDEPEFKATFKIYLEVDAKLTALSNGKILSETGLSSARTVRSLQRNTDGSNNTGIAFSNQSSQPELQFADETAPTNDNASARKLVEFAETMLLSTYLVAFAVGDFASSRQVTVNGTQIRIFCVPGKEHLTEFALECAAFAVDFYERYFEIPYPAEKIDHIAIPDFPIGAMENLGLITFRETALLVDEKLSSHAGLIRVSEIIMHELAHMWFGDLVTMRWWNGLWLKESFATFMANMAVDSFRPEWRVWNDFALSRADASETDALKNTHAIENPVNHPDEATEMFDVISYQKGCSVLYQLHEFIGAETFRKGCARYLKTHSFGNTETVELWDALDQAAQQANLGLRMSVGDIMEAWVFNSGHPIIFVHQGELPGSIVLKQRMFRFVEDGEVAFVWPIPVTIRVTKKDGATEIKKLLMLNREEIVYLGEDARSYIVNALGSGFYRVSYQPELIEAVTEDLHRLSVVERFNLINDAWSTVRSGLTPIGDYIEILKLYKEETDSAVWQVIYDSLEHLNSWLDEDDKPNMARLIRNLCAPNLAILGWQPQSLTEGVDSRKLRALVIKLMAVVGNDATIVKSACLMYESWRKDSTRIDAELVPSIVHIVAHEGDRKTYNDFLRLSRDASTPQDTIRFLYALARFRRQELLLNTASLCLSPEVRAQDAPYLFAAVIRNPQGGDLAWEFLKTNFDEMKARFPDLAMHKMVEALSVLDTPQLESDIRKFFCHHRISTRETAVRQMLEQLHVNVRLRQKERAALKAALAE
ncbi:MAG: M1 family metallopeptidase [Candidatus Melainabacteria bacterium]|nr:M1 family metallopeptidase [Candidatus Melainabacteria bacterium]